MVVRGWGWEHGSEGGWEHGGEGAGLGAQAKPHSLKNCILFLTFSSRQ